MLLLIKKVLQDPIKAWGRLITHLSVYLAFIVFAIRARSKIKFCYRRYENKSLVRSISADDPEYYQVKIAVSGRGKAAIYSPKIRIKPVPHPISFFSTMDEVTITGKEKIGFKHNKFVYHDTWKFDLNRIFPFFAIASWQAGSIACEFLHNPRVYYHHLTETYFFYFLVNRYLPHLRILHFGKLHPWEHVIWNLMGIKEKIVSAPTRLLDADIASVIFRNKHLTMSSEIGIQTRPSCRKVFRDYTSSLIASAIKNDSCELEPEQKIFVIRADSEERQRNPNNHDEIRRIFQSYNYAVIDWRDFSLIQQILLSNGALVIAGIHGSNLTNIMFQKRGAFVFEIHQTSSIVNLCFSNVASSVGLRYFSIGGQTIQGNQYCVNSELLIGKLNTIEEHLAVTQTLVMD